jgi:hypothetical protein
LEPRSYSVVRAHLSKSPGECRDCSTDVIPVKPFGNLMHAVIDRYLDADSAVPMPALGRQRQFAAQVPARVGIGCRSMSFWSNWQGAGLGWERFVVRSEPLLILT